MRIAPFPTEPRQQIVAGVLRDYGLLDERVSRWSYEPTGGSDAFVFCTEYRQTPGPLENDIITLSVLNDRELWLNYRARTRTLLSPGEYIRYDDQRKQIIEERRVEGEGSTSRADTLRAVWYWLEYSFGIYAVSLGIYKDAPEPRAPPAIAAQRIKLGLQDLGEEIIQWQEVPWRQVQPGIRPRPV